MEVTALLVALFIESSAISANAVLSVSPDRSQFFRYESLSLSCDGSRNASGWTVWSRTVRGVSECGRDWGSVQARACVIGEAYAWHSGAYWCESASGESSGAANVSVSETSVILESPASPVTGGEAVTLRCTTRSNGSTLRPHVFLKDRAAVAAALTGRMSISAASASDRGLYMCVITDVGASAESWLEVRGRGPASVVSEPEDQVVGSEGPDPAAPFLPSGLRVMGHLLVSSPYLASTVLLGLVDRH